MIESELEKRRGINMPLFAEVIPFIRLPRSINFFDYRIPDNLTGNLKIGSIVFIPFRNKKIIGFVSKVKEQSNVPFYKLKNITNLITDKYLDQNQIKIFNWLVENYATAPSIIIKMFFPFTSKKYFEELNNAKPKTLKKQSVKKIKHQWLEHRSTLIQYDNGDKILNDYIDFAKNYIKSNQQLLILFPRLTLLNNFYKLLPKTIQEVTDIYRVSGQKINQQQETFKNIKINKTKIILGTRSALFAPFANLDCIVIDHEESPDHRQEEPNPRYHPIDVIKFLQSQNNKLFAIYSSPLPSCERYFDVKAGQMPFIKSDKFDQADPNVTILDSRIYESTRATYPLHFELEQAIAETLDAGKSIFLLVNKLGESSSLVCNDCGWSPTCPNCQINLSIKNEKTANETLYCYRCNYKQASVPFCPECQSAKIKYKGLGIQKISELIKKLFPKIPVKIITKDIKKEITDKKQEQKIILGTSNALDYVDFANIALIGVLSSDGALFSPQFRSAERFAQLLSSLQSLNPQAKLFIQTLAPEHGVYNIFKNSPQYFIENELLQRQNLNYPPYNNIIKLIIQNSKKAQAEKNASNWIDKNQTICEKNEIEIIGPIQPNFSYIRQKYRQNIILRTNHSDKFNSIIPQIPLDWIIDKNPENLV